MICSAVYQGSWLWQIQRHTDHTASRSVAVACRWRLTDAAMQPYWCSVTKRQWVYQRSYSMSSLVSTGMGYHLWMGTPSWYVTSQLTKLLVGSLSRITQPCILLVSPNSVPALLRKVGMSPLPGGRQHCVIPYGMWVPVAVRPVADHYTPFTLLTSFHCVAGCVWGARHGGPRPRVIEKYCPRCHTYWEEPSTVLCGYHRLASFDQRRTRRWLHSPKQGHLHAIMSQTVDIGFYPRDTVLVWVLAMARCLCLTITSRCSIRMDRWIKLAWRLRWTYPIVYYIKIQVSTKIRVLLCGTLS